MRTVIRHSPCQAIGPIAPVTDMPGSSKQPLLAGTCSNQEVAERSMAVTGTHSLSCGLLWAQSQWANCTGCCQQHTKLAALGFQASSCVQPYGNPPWAPLLRRQPSDPTNLCKSTSHALFVHRIMCAPPAPVYQRCAQCPQPHMPVSICCALLLAPKRGVLCPVYSSFVTQSSVSWSVQHCALMCHCKACSGCCLKCARQQLVGVCLWDHSATCCQHSYLLSFVLSGCLHCICDADKGRCGPLVGSLNHKNEPGRHLQRRTESFELDLWRLSANN